MRRYQTTCGASSTDASKLSDGLVAPPQPVQDEAAPIQGVGVRRIKFQGAVKGVESVKVTAHAAQHLPAAHPGFDAFRLPCQTLIESGQGVVVPVQGAKGFG